VFANDSTALIDTYGIHFKKSAAVVMLSERLYISRDIITVDYVFRNETAQDVTETIAFPMPRQPGGADGIRPFADVAAYARSFSVVADGNPVNFQRILRALMPQKNGVDRDITDRLRVLGLSDKDIVTDPPGERLERRLKKAGFELYNGLPWAWQEHYFWQQTFLAGKEVRISHSYVPLAGFQFYGAEWDDLTWLRKDYCLDRQEMGRIRKEAVMGVSRPINYVLTTGANWFGPIRDFELIIEKRDADDHLSLCWPESDFRKESATRFVTRIKNFTPSRDISLVFYSLNQ
jgi:hypothetical protein